jgi:hypothetical protein
VLFLLLRARSNPPMIVQAALNYGTKDNGVLLPIVGRVRSITLFSASVYRVFVRHCSTTQLFVEGKTPDLCCTDKHYAANRETIHEIPTSGDWLIRENSCWLKGWNDSFAAASRTVSKMSSSGDRQPSKPPPVQERLHSQVSYAQ